MYASEIKDAANKQHIAKMKLGDKYIIRKKGKGISKVKAHKYGLISG